MKRMIIDPIVREDIKRAAEAREELKKYPQEVVDYVKECREQIIDEINRHYYSGDTDVDTPVGSTLSAIKRDYMVGAIEDDMMTEEEFEEIYDCLDIISLEYAHAYA